MEETISLQDIFKILKKRVVLIFLTTIIGVLAAGFITFFVITPKYSSEAQLIVTLTQSDTASVNANDVNANLMMLNTYKDLIKGNAVLTAVKEKAATEKNYKGSVSDLDKMITVNQSTNSQMFSIVATGTNAYEAESIANITADVFTEKVKEVLSVDKISIISDAKVNTEPVSPNNKLNVVIGLVIGLMAGVGLAFLLEFLDKTVKDERFISDSLGFNVLGSVPQMTAKELNAKILVQNHVRPSVTFETTGLSVTRPSSPDVTIETKNKEVVPERTRRSRSRV